MKIAVEEAGVIWYDKEKQSWMEEYLTDDFYVKKITKCRWCDAKLEHKNDSTGL